MGKTIESPEKKEVEVDSKTIETPVKKEEVEITEVMQVEVDTKTIETPEVQKDEADNLNIDKDKAVEINIAEITDTQTETEINEKPDFVDKSPKTEEIEKTTWQVSPKLSEEKITEVTEIIKNLHSDNNTQLEITF